MTTKNLKFTYGSRGMKERGDFLVWSDPFGNLFILLIDLTRNIQFYVDKGTLIKRSSGGITGIHLNSPWKSISRDEFLRCVVGGPNYIRENHVKKET